MDTLREAQVIDGSFRSPLFAEYVQRYASKDASEEKGAESEDDDDMSSVASFGEDDDEEPAGRLDDV